MTLRTTLKSAASHLPFAHLAGLARPGAKAAGDEDPEAKGKGKGKDGGKDSADDLDGKKARKDDDAEGDPEEDPDGDDNGDGDGEDREDDDAEGDPDEDPKKGKKGKKGKKAKAGKKDDAGDDDNDGEDEGEGDDESDGEEMKGDSPIAMAGSRERARCAAIFASPHAARNIQLAATLAFRTSLTRKEVLAVLATAPAGASRLAERMASHKNPDIGGGGDAPAPTGQAAIDRSWDAVMKRAQG